MLCFVVLNVAALKEGDNGHCKSWFGLAIGFVIVAGAYGAGAVSGGCFNPAVATAIGVSGGSFGPIAPYFIAELLGGGLAAGFFKVVRPTGEVVSDKSTITAKEVSIGSKLAAEFIGTFFLVLTVGLNVLGKSPAAAFSIAASLMCMICAVGDVSGANFNPAVSLCLIINGALDATTAGMYMGVQILGGVVAAACYSAIYGGAAFPLGPGMGFTLGGAAVAEIFYTFVLCLVVLGAAVHPKTAGEHFFPLAIGSCVTVGGYAIGSISGGSLNPAVSFGIASAAAVSHGTGSIINAVAYSVFEFIGAGIAAGVIMATHAESKDDALEV
jgi:aquaporin Z